MALKRLPSRADERGAALFIVVLIVVLLTGIGAFAAHATAFTQTAAGYSRRASSAFYIGEFGMNLLAADMTQNEDEYLQNAKSGGNTCRNNLGVVAATGFVVPCLVKEAGQLEKDLDSTIKTDPDGAVYGALSRPDRPADQAVRASYTVEITDPGPTGEVQPGMSSKYQFMRAAVTTTARLLPFSTQPDCSEDTSRSSETQSFRGYVVFQTTEPPPLGAL